MRKDRLERLATHAAGIFHSIVLPEVTPQGCILVTDPNENVAADPVTTHHLVDLCIEIDPHLTDKIIQNACDWLLQNGGGVQDPFVLTSLAVSGALKGTKHEAELVELIANNQRPSGFIDLYAGFLDGGSIFSTLWAVRILLHLDSSRNTQSVVDRALNAIEQNWSDVHRNSFKTFYCELRWLNGDQASPRSKTATTIREVCQAQDVNGFWDNSPLYTAYILGNLCNFPGPSSRATIRSIEKGLVSFFDLDHEVTGLPPIMSRVRKTSVESLFLQTAIRAAITAIRYLRTHKDVDTSRSIVSSIIGAFPDTYQTARVYGAQLKRMNDQYGHIQERFKHLDKATEQVLEESPYERNVFIMMPFRQERDERYEEIERVLKSELKKEGFRGWLATDKNLAAQLWDNVVAFMISCKYGIAVFTRLEKEKTIEEEFNPNVSLELGFCLSRGRNVLILKDVRLGNLQTDLVGHLYEEFDLNQVRKEIRPKVRKWVREIKKTEAAVPDQVDA